MFQRLFLSIAAIAIAAHAAAQTPPPKLVIGIVVDQMRYDYLYKYANDYGNGGFKRLLDEGQLYSNAHYSYVPTYTAPGHASIYTGTTPARHGIVGNDWYQRQYSKSTYCVSDSSVKTIGANTVKTGQMSPRTLLATTVGDELRVASNRRSKVIGIALKDRAAILPAGAIANGAYWFDGESGNFITSSFYADSLPRWLKDFNAKQRGAALLSQAWTRLLPEENYDESLPDVNPYEGPFKGNSSVAFPYDLPKLMGTNGGQNLIRATPFGNTLTREMAEAAIVGEQLGKDAFPDLLCVSFSSPDYIGHQFGTDAQELQDCYLRLDRELEKLISFAENQAGKGNVLIFLTADHGGATVPAYLMELNAQGGYMNYSPMRDSVNLWLNRKFQGAGWLETISNEQLYLNEKAIEAAGKNLGEVEDYLAYKLSTFPGVLQSFTATQMRSQEFTTGIGAKIQKGYYAKRSGNVMLALEPNWMEYSKTGTTHGSPWTYDTRVPMLFWGWKLKPGEQSRYATIEDIAPTLSHWLNIPFPNACSGFILQPRP